MPPAASIDERIQAELGAMHMAAAGRNHAFQGLLVKAQEYDWVAAESYRDRAAALFEAEMDAFIRTCRLMDQRQGGHYD